MGKVTGHRAARARAKRIYTKTLSTIFLVNILDKSVWDVEYLDGLAIGVKRRQCGKRYSLRSRYRQTDHQDTHRKG